MAGHHSVNIHRWDAIVRAWAAGDERVPQTPTAGKAAPLVTAIARPGVLDRDCRAGTLTREECFRERNELYNTYFP
ncbi:hypothetical protein [Embleya sp. NBC_00896]|uniref:hypothetical protein n=1 Tax=Embleya sp. NBC_00896 TaxID=2975961 RepID=UPI003869ECFB|nr:hypothetical protein OG928_33885 [Embleya sp. NBC_00896]